MQRIEKLEATQTASACSREPVRHGCVVSARSSQCSIEY